MRHFYILLGNTPKLSRRGVDRGEVSDDVAELCSCIRAALFLSHDIRRDVKVHLVFLEEKKEAVIDGGNVRYLSPDERSLCMLLIKLGERKNKKPWRGVYINEFTSLQDIFPSDGVLLVASDKGDDLRQVKNLKEVMIVVPLHPSGELLKQLSHTRTLPVKVLGKLLPSHFITVLNNQIDVAEEYSCIP